EQRPAALGLDVALHLLGVGVLLQVDDRDVGALLGEVQRHGASDAAIAAGDQRHLALELAGGLVVGPLVPGLGDHLVLAPGLPVLLLGRLALASRLVLSGLPLLGRRLA